MHYFAYGSNLHPMRLLERVHSATLVGITRVGKHRLVFHKRSIDGSSKCNLLETGTESDLVYGAIYEIEPEHKPALDRFEWRGCGYMDGQINVQYKGQEYACFTYMAQRSHIVGNLKPYHWYKKLVVLGASYLQFPAAYVASIEAVESVEDRDELGREQSYALIERMIKHG